MAYNFQTKSRRRQTIGINAATNQKAAEDRSTKLIPLRSVSEGIRWAETQS